MIPFSVEVEIRSPIVSALVSPVAIGLAVVATGCAPRPTREARPTADGSTTVRLPAPSLPNREPAPICFPLSAIGIVTNLPGTGDSPQFLPTVRIAEMHRSEVTPADLDRRSIALVTVEMRTEPDPVFQERLVTLIRSIGDATSIAGGRLSLTPVCNPIAPHHPVMWVRGWVRGEDPSTPSCGILLPD